MNIISLTKYFSFFICFFIAGCSSIPLSSLVKLSTFDQSDLKRIRAEDVRARISLDEPGKLKLAQVKLALKFEYDRNDSHSHSHSHSHKSSEVEEHQFLLSMIDNEKLSVESWFSKKKVRNRYVFKISDSSLKDFNRFQERFLKNGEPRKYFWTVYYYLEKESSSMNELKLDLELKLEESEEYFFLLKEAEVIVNRNKDQH